MMQKITKGLFSTIPVQSVAGLHPFAQCIYMWLCKYSNEDNQCRPSINTLCKNTGISKNSLIKYLNLLERKGFIKKTNRCKEGEYTSNMYDVFVLGGSAGDEQGGSAGDELPGAGDGNKLNPLTKSTFLTTGKKKFTTVDDFYQDIIEGDYIDKLCPDIDHKRLKNRIIVCLDWRKKEKKQVTIPKTAITKRLKDRNGNRDYEKKKIEYVPKTEEEMLNAPLEDN